LHDKSDTAIISNHQCNHLTFTTRDARTRLQDRGWQQVSSFFVFFAGGHKFGLLGSEFSFSNVTCLDSVFLEFYRLSCHGRFVASQLNRLEAQAIDGDVHAVLDHNDVAHMQIVVV
jgi:hypothetical protein